MRTRKFYVIVVQLALLLIMGFTMPSCAKVKTLVFGDPRKNCNHPKHGDWVREQRMKKHGY